MKVYVVTDYSGVVSVHWTEEGASKAAITNTSGGRKREVTPIDMAFDQMDGSYFKAIAKLTDMATTALALVNVLRGRTHAGDTFQTMEKASKLADQLEQMKKDFAL